MNASDTQLDPYRPPQYVAEPHSSNAANRERSSVAQIVAWPIIFSLNLILCLLIALEATADAGRIGILIAVISLLALTWYFVIQSAYIGRRMLIGGALMALTQFFPIIQIILGVMAFGVAEGMGIASSVGDAGPEINSELCGFILTIMVGSGLLVLAALIGWLIGLMLPPTNKVE